MPPPARSSTRCSLLADDLYLHTWPESVARCETVEYAEALQLEVRKRHPTGQRFLGIVAAQAVEIAHHVSGRFESGEADEVWLVHSEFVSTMTQTPRVVDLLPMAAGDAGERGDDEAKTPYTIEPDAEQLLQVLAPKALQTEIFRALLDSQAGEHAARMTAMESATRNTEELISRLTLEYNRARQAAITKELVEIVSGAEAL